MEFKRISVNLHHYFNDYRQLALICIKKHMKTIEDLKIHIQKVFEIKDTFYLKCQNHYLPSLEDLNILSENDLVSVVPYNQTALDEQEVYAERKRKKKKLSNEHHITDNNSEIENLETTNKKFQNCVSNCINSEINDTNENDKNKKKGKKSKKKEKLKEFEKIKDVSAIKNISQIDICDTDVEGKSKKRRRCISPIEKINNKSNLQELFKGKHVFENNINKEIEKDSERRNSIVLSVELVTEDKQQELNEQYNLNTESSKIYTKEDVVDFKENKNLNKSNTKDVTQNSPYKNRKYCLGVGNIIKHLNSDNAQNDSDQSQLGENFITKRRRVRTRKRKQKIANVPEIEKAEENLIFIPPRTKAAPKSHIKFTNDEDENQNNTETGFIHSTPLNKSYTNNTRIENEDDFLICNLDMSKFSELTQSPTKNSIILFKTLKLGENYNPIVSNYILAEVKEVSETGEQLKLKLLDGHEELKDPIGKFTNMTEDDAEEEFNDNSTLIIERKTLLEVKIQNKIHLPL